MRTAVASSVCRIRAYKYPNYGLIVNYLLNTFAMLNSGTNYFIRYE